jgi:hypothetical protein
LPPGITPPPGVTYTRVHITANAPNVVLERRLGSLPTDPYMPKSVYASPDFDWKPVCAAPCDAMMQLGGDYRIAGEGVTTSSNFALHGPTTDLQVEAGSYGRRRAGAWVAVIGFLTGAVGGIFLAVEAVRLPKQPLDTGGYVSIGALVGGVVVGSIGVGVGVAAGTSVRDETRKELARIAPPSVLNATYSF